MKQPMGLIDFSYIKLALPLAEAHKIQAILAAHAIRLDTTYSSGNPTLVCIKDFTPPSVDVLTDELIDCRGMDSKLYSEWTHLMSTREKGAPIMPAKDFAALKGETNE